MDDDAVTEIYAKTINNNELPTGSQLIILFVLFVLCLIILVYV